MATKKQEPEVTEKKQPAKKAAPKKTESKKAEPKKTEPKKASAEKQPEAPKKKPAAKKTAPAETKSSSKPKEPAKKAAPKKRAPKKSDPVTLEGPDLYGARADATNRRSIAQKTVDWKTGKTTRKLRWLALIPLLMLIVFFKYFMIGYSFTVLVLWCLVGILMFYNLCDLLQSKNFRWIKAVKRIFTFLLCVGLLIVGITECLIIHASFGDPKETVDYIVVLGAKVREDGPSVSLMDRIYAARDYLQEHPEVTAVLSGGKGEDEPITEAECMYQELVALGVDPGRLWIENNATSTWENMHFTLDLIEEKTGQRPEKLGVLSSEYHLFRAGLFAEACGIESVGIPARTSRVSQMVNHFMREVAGVWHYLLLGGQYE